MKNNFFSFINELLSEFISGLPGFGSLLLLLLAFFAWAFLCSEVSVYLKTKRALRTGYTRKTYHFLVFISAAAINLVFGFSGVCLFGIIVSCFIFYALFRRKASGLYLALAREADHPNSALYVIIPYFSTLSGGILINYFFPELVILGYLVCGVADASGEVIGTRLGKHKFTVRILNIHKSVKSLEGSGSIFLFSFLIYLVYSLVAGPSPDFGMILWIMLSSLIVTIAEILTPKGFDNLSIQILAVLVYMSLIAG
jgi:phytol kinase